MFAVVFSLLALSNEYKTAIWFWMILVISNFVFPFSVFYFNHIIDRIKMQMTRFYANRREADVIVKLEKREKVNLKQNVKQIHSEQTRFKTRSLKQPADLIDAEQVLYEKVDAFTPTVCRSLTILLQSHRITSKDSRL